MKYEIKLSEYDGKMKKELMYRLNEITDKTKELDNLKETTSLLFDLFSIKKPVTLK